MTFERALQIRRLAAALPETVPVLETDAPDIPPHWLYRTADAARGRRASRATSPAELPRIAPTLAALRGWSLERDGRASPRPTPARRCRACAPWRPGAAAMTAASRLRSACRR